MTVRAQNELDCTNILEVRFPLTNAQMEILKIKPLKSIRYINGNDKSYFIYKITKNDKYYFIKKIGKYQK